MANKDHLQMTWGDFSTYRTQLYGISALWVMLFHCNNVNVHFSGELLPLRIVEAFLNHGNMGVDIFLFLSGMSLHFAYGKYEGRLTEFQKHRFLRLYVPVAVVYLPHWIWWAATKGGFARWMRLPLKLSGMELWLRGEQEIWFVGLIALCYLMYPYLHGLLTGTPARRNRHLAVLLSVTVLLTVSMMITVPDYYAMVEVAVARVPMFLLGCWAGPLVKKGVALPRWTVPAAWTAVLYWMCRYVFAPVSLPLLADRYEYIFSSFAVMVVSIHLVRLLNIPPVQKPLHFFGTHSLELYLAHLMLIATYRETPWYREDDPIRYLILMVCATVVAWLAGKIGGHILKRIK